MHDPKDCILSNQPGIGVLGLSGNIWQSPDGVGQVVVDDARGLKSSSWGKKHADERRF